MRWTIIQQADGSWAVVDGAGNVIEGTQSPTREEAVDRLRELATSALGDLPEGGIASGRGARFRMTYMEGERTSDGRIIDPGATNFNRQPPLPLMLTTETSEGHLGAQLSGVIDTARREGNQIVLDGNFDAGSDAGIEHERLVREGIMNTWSPDIGDADIRMEVIEDPDAGDGEDDMLGLLLGLGDTLMHLTSGTLLGGTGVPFPALASARIESLAASLVAGGFPYVRPTGSIEIIDETVTADGAPEECVECEEERAAYAVLSQAVADKRLSRAEEAAAITAHTTDGQVRWPDVLDELRPKLEDVSEPEPATDGIVEATEPIVVGESGPEEVQLPASTIVINEVVQDPRLTADAVAQRLAAETFRPPAEWFEDPKLDAPTPMTVTPEGRVFGHLAQWGVCHTGILDRCVMAPRSRSNYAYFMQGSVVCDDGARHRVGHITIGPGHADLSLDPDRARAHYDGGPGAFCAAHVAVGEDRHGVWFSGTVDPRLDDFQRWELETLAISGDWRTLGGSLELIAALSVPVPGFPILASAFDVKDAVPQPEFFMNRGEVVSIVAAGAVAPRRVSQAAELAELRERVAMLEAKLEARTEPLLSSAAERYRARLRGE